MQRQRDGLIPMGEAFSGLADPVKKALQPSPQARHHFTVADQVHQLVGASEADPDRGFMARLMALCSLPRTNPGNRLQYKRVNGPYTLIMYSSGETKLPFGNFPRLILAWVCTEAVLTKSRVIVLGDSLSKFMKTLGIYSSGGGREQIKLRNQMRRLFGCTVQLVYKDEHGERFVNSPIATRGAYWWNTLNPSQPSLWDSTIELGVGLLQRDNPSPGPVRHEHPQGTQAVRPGIGSLPMADLPHLHASCSVTALLAAGVPSVWPAPGQRQRQAHRP